MTSSPGPIPRRRRVIIPVDLAGIVCDYETLYRVLEGEKRLFHANTKNEIQKHFDRVIVMADSAHGFGAVRDGKRFRVLCRFYLLLFPRSKKSDHGRRWTLHGKLLTVLTMSGSISSI